MLRVKRLMCLLFLILLSDICISTITPFHALATGVVEDNDIEMAHKNKTKLAELNKKPIELQEEKMKQKELENKVEEKKNEPERKEFILTFYTSLISENSSAGPVTCENHPLTPGGVANNIIPLNTKIYLEGYGQVTVNDRGSDKYFDVDNRLDVYVEREPGESDKQYYNRVNSYGIQKVQGYIVK